MNGNKNNKKNGTVQDVSSGQRDTRKFKLGDFVAKIVCVAFSFIIWFYVMEVESPEYEQVFSSVPVTIINTAQLETERNLSIYSGYGGSVDITVKGKKSDINKIKNEDIIVTADALEIEQAGVKSLDINVELPVGLSFSSLSQYSIRVYSDIKDTKTVDVITKITHIIVEEPNQTGTPVPEYSEITVTGPKGVLDSISHAQVNLDLGKISKTTNIIGEIKLISDTGEVITNPYVKPSRSEVYVTVPVFIYKEVPLSVDFKYGYFNSENVDISIEPNTIKLKGDPDILDGYASFSIGTIDEKNIADDGRQIFSINLPDGIENVDGIETAEVNIVHKNTSTRKYVINDINVIGAGGLKYEVIDKQISVRFRGSIEDINNMRSTDIIASIDLSGYSNETSGIVSETVSFTFADGVGDSVYELGTYTVQVSIGN